MHKCIQASAHSKVKASCCCFNEAISSCCACTGAPAGAPPQDCTSHVPRACKGAVLLRLIPAEKHAIRPSNALGKNVINQNSATDYHDSPVRSEVLMQVSFRKRGNDAQFKPISRELPCTHHEPMMIHNYLRTIQIDIGK